MGKFDLTSLAQRARIVNNTIKNLSEVVADAMKEMHGGTWRAVIDHENGFITIRPDTEKAIAKPRRGVTV